MDRLKRYVDMSVLALSPWIQMKKQAIVSTIVFALASYSVGQGNVLKQRIESADFQDVSFRQVLKSLFKSVDASYSIAADVDGRVTINKKDATFELIFQNVLAQINATYLYEGGVFCIIKHEPPLEPLNPSVQRKMKDGEPSSKVYVVSPDPGLVRLLLPGSEPEMRSIEIKSLVRFSSGFVKSGFTDSGFTKTRLSARFLGGGFGLASLI